MLVFPLMLELKNRMKIEIKLQPQISTHVRKLMYRAKHSTIFMAMSLPYTIPEISHLKVAQAGDFERIMKNVTLNIL